MFPKEVVNNFLVLGLLRDKKWSKHRGIW